MMTPLATRLVRTKGNQVDTPTITLELTPEDTAILIRLLSAGLAGEEDGVQGWSNKNEKSLDRLFAHFDTMARLGDLWVRVHRAMGIPQEAIAEFFAEN
jgi:hypothetical protein